MSASLPVVPEGEPHRMTLTELVARIAGADLKNRGSERLFYRPVEFVDSGRDGAPPDTGAFCPLCDSEALPAKRKEAAVAFVTRLLLRRCPSAVTGLIPALVVDAVQGKPFWLFSHVCKEVLEGIPPGAHVDSASPVVMESSVVEVPAAGMHELPGGIGTGCSSLRTMSMSTVGVPADICSSATARSGMTVGEVAAPIGANGSAVTRAHESFLVRGLRWWKDRSHHQAFESVANSYLKALLPTHATALLITSHYTTDGGLRA